MEKMHASVIAIGKAAVLLRGPSGAGKSDLALRLIANGAQLVSDDYVELQELSGKIWAHAPQTIAGMIEVRGLGLIKIPHISGVQVALACDLVSKDIIERLPEQQQWLSIGDCQIPLMQVDSQTASAPARITLALDQLRQIWPPVPVQ